MKKLDKLLLKSFVGPLVLTFAISVFVLLMQFVWKYIDDMVGKGLSFGVLAELLCYASATFVPMALPIAVLFASIMTMGNFGEKYELVAMKAGGVSISRVMMPMVVVAVLLTGLAFYFANNVMPVAMLKYKTTLYDVTRKKPALNIRPSEYYSDIEGYVIRVNGKKSDGTLEDIIIYDHTQGQYHTNVVVAQSGFMQTSPDERYLIFTLNNGHTYMEDTEGENTQSRPFTSIAFEQQVLTFDLSSFAFNKSDEEFFKGSYQMMNLRQLDTSIAQLEISCARRYDECLGDVFSRMPAWHLFCESCDTIAPDSLFSVAQVLDSCVASDRDNIFQHAQYIVTGNSGDIKMYQSIIQSDTEYINRHYIEWHRKFTLSVACLLLFLIGAPFGSIVRKGGLGMPLVASVIFFVLYYVIGMIAEKAVREGAIGPIGMWISSFVLLPIGILLTVQATTDSSFFDGATWRKRFRRLLHKPEPSTAPTLQ